MTNEQIKQLALALGFKLKTQPDGVDDLNPYVYEFAQALLSNSQHIVTAGTGDLQFGQGVMGDLPAIFITKLENPVPIGQTLITEMTPVDDFMVCLQFKNLQSVRVLINQALLLLQYQGDEASQCIVPKEALSDVLGVAGEAIISELSDLWLAQKGCSTWADYAVANYDVVSTAMGHTTIRQQVTGDSDG